jgi:hypothetical protein
VKRVLVALLLTLSVATACQSPAHRSNGGVRVIGTVTVGGCPVVGPSAPPCPATPMGGVTLAVRDASGGEVARTTSGGDGVFHLRLPLGRYSIVAIDPPPPAMPGQKPVEFAVSSHRTISIQIVLDNGVR